MIDKTNTLYNENDNTKSVILDKDDLQKCIEKIKEISGQPFTPEIKPTIVSPKIYELFKREGIIKGEDE